MDKPKYQDVKISRNTRLINFDRLRRENHNEFITINEMSATTLQFCLQTIFDELAPQNTENYDQKTTVAKL